MSCEFSTYRYNGEVYTGEVYDRYMLHTVCDDAALIIQ